MAEYKTYYDMIVELPIVQELMKENKKLTKKNKILKYKNKALNSILYELSVNIGTTREQQLELRNNTITIPIVKVKEEKLDEPTLCDTLANDTDSVVFIDNVNLKENIVYDLEQEDENDLNNGFDDSNEEAQNIIKDLKNELNSEEVEEEEVEEEEVEEEEVEEEEIEEREGASEGTVGSLEEVEEEEVEEEEVEEEEVEEEEVEEEEVEEEEEEVEEREGASEGTVGSLEEEDEEVEEVTIKGKSYYTSNKISGIIYEITKDEEVGDEVGVFKEGKAVFHKK